MSSLHSWAVNDTIRQQMIQRSCQRLNYAPNCDNCATSHDSHSSWQQCAKALEARKVCTYHDSTSPVTPSVVGQMNS